MDRHPPWPATFGQLQFDVRQLYVLGAMAKALGISTKQDTEEISR